MPVVALTDEAFSRLMWHLMPPGPLWRDDEDSVLGRVFLAAADELVRLSQRTVDAIEESDPRTTTELLPEWESILRLDGSGTDAERRARIIGALLGTRVRPVDYQNATAAALDLDPSDVKVFERTLAEIALHGDENEVYRFFIYRDPTLSGTPSIDDAQAIVDAMEHSHTKGHVIESLAFKCNDQYSLLDRDPIGYDPRRVTYDTPGMYSVPVRGAVTYSAIGGGGGTEDAATASSGGGGGGGSVAAETYAATETVTVTVGSGGAVGAAGGDSGVVESGPTTVCLAKGGAAGANGAAGAGGAAGSGVGDSTFSGGAGGANSGFAGGGGGGAAGTTGAGTAGTAAALGTPGSGGAGGTGDPAGGAGGNGGASATQGTDGTSPGGGGGGDGDGTNGGTSGGDGVVSIDFPLLPYKYEEI